MFYETTAYKTLLNQIENWNRYTVKCVLVYGPVGVGKTFIVRKVAEKLNYEIQEYGSEYDGDISNIVTVGRTKPWMSAGRIILLDRPYKWMKTNDLKEIINNSSNPVLIECLDSEAKYYRWLGCLEVPVDPPPKTWIVKVIKGNKIVDKPKYNMITNDVRQALLIGLGSQGYREEDWYSAVERYFRYGETEELELSHLPVLLDTAPTAFYGINLFNFIQKLVVADMIKSTEILSGVKPDFKTFQIRYRYYKKLKERD